MQPTLAHQPESSSIVFTTVLQAELMNEPLVCEIKAKETLPEGAHLAHVQVNSFQNSAQLDSLSRAHIYQARELLGKHPAFWSMGVASDG